MSIEKFLADQKNKPLQFKHVAKKLLSEKEPPEDLRPWKWEEEVGEKELEEIYDWMSFSQIEGGWVGFAQLNATIRQMDSTKHHPIPKTAWQKNGTNIDKIYKNKAVTLCLCACCGNATT